MFYDNADFFRVTEGGTTRIPSTVVPRRVRHTISMAPLKSVAISTFSFPFNNSLRVREALKLQTLPYAAAGGMELFPSVLEKTARNSRGVVWYVPATELESVTPPLANVENRVWPAPMALVSKIRGEGVTLWTDEQNICSMLWRNGEPVLYRWKTRAKTSEEAERAWYEAYCKSKEEEVGEFFALNATLPSEAVQLPEIIKESLTQYPWLAEVNLSRSALDTALILERIVHSGTRVAGWLLILGLLVAFGNGLRYYEGQRNIDLLRDRSSNLYREVFDTARTGRISNPLGLARNRLEERRGKGSEGKLINEVFSDLGTIFEQNPSMDVTLDSVRYNLDGVDYTGSAPDVATIQSFQKAWGGKAASAQLGNLASSPGVGFRFDLSVRW